MLAAAKLSVAVWPDTSNRLVSPAAVAVVVPAPRLKTALVVFVPLVPKTDSEPPEVFSTVVLFALPRLLPTVTLPLIVSDWPGAIRRRFGVAVFVWTFRGPNEALAAVRSRVPAVVTALLMPKFRPPVRVALLDKA